jgi:hypothetical protein
MRNTGVCYSSFDGCNHEEYFSWFACRVSKIHSLCMTLTLGFIYKCFNTNSMCIYIYIVLKCFGNIILNLVFLFFHHRNSLAGYGLRMSALHETHL